MLFCGLPDNLERESILEAIFSDMDPSSRNSRKWQQMIEFIAERTEGFSGADLQGILDSIQADAMTADFSYEGAAPALESIIVPATIDAVLQSARPSVGREEYDELMLIYSEFMSSTSKKGTGNAKIKGKAKSRSMEFGFRTALA